MNFMPGLQTGPKSERLPIQDPAQAIETATPALIHDPPVRLLVLRASAHG